MKYSELIGNQVKHRLIRFERLNHEQLGAGVELARSDVIKLIVPYIVVRLYAQIKAVAPLALYLTLFQFLILQQTISNPMSVTLGLSAVVFGLSVFMEGLKTGLMPFGSVIGNQLPKQVSVFVTLVIIAILGIGVTFAEPAIGALQSLGASIDPGHAPYLYEVLKNRSLELVLVVGLGVGLAAVVGVLRFLNGWSLKPLIYAALTPAILLTLYAWFDPNLISMLGLAWDCGAVTTGPVTVPLLLSLGVGLANAAGKGKSSLSGFGVVTLASLFPIIVVLMLCIGLSFVITPEEIQASFHNASQLSDAPLSLWAQTPIKEIVLGIRAILPLVLFLLFVLFYVLRSKLENRLLTYYGLTLCVVGMCTFNIGLSYGLESIGSQTGSALPSAFMSIENIELSPIYTKHVGLTLVVLFAWCLGFGATVAEPALNALGIVVQTLTQGAFKKSLLIYSVASGVAFGIALGITKIVFSLDLVTLLLPLYGFAIILTYFSTEEFVNVAWDSAGVTTGPVTVPLVMATGLGLGNALALPDGFGILSLASICPIITVLSMGLYIKVKQDFTKEEEVA